MNSVAVEYSVVHEVELLNGTAGVVVVVTSGTDELLFEPEMTTGSTAVMLLVVSGVTGTEEVMVTLENWAEAPATASEATAAEENFIASERIGDSFLDKCVCSGVC